MNPQEAVSKIRLLLGLNETTLSFMSTTLVDGTVIETEGEFVEGAMVYVATEEGNMPVAAGIYESTDNVLMTIDEMGMIVKIEETVEESIEETTETVEEVAMEEVVVEVPEEVAPIMTEEVVQAVIEALTPMVEEVAAITEELKKMKAQFQAFAAEPAAKKVKRNDFSAEMETTVDRIAKLRKNK